MSNEQVLTVPGRYKEIKRICEFVAAGAARAGFDESTIFHLELCCDEASTNIIEHAYGEEGVGNIVISYRVSEDDFTIVMHDNGEAFDPGAVPPPPAVAHNNASAEELTSQLRIGGLGLHFIRNLMDEVHFTSDQQRGNQLVMVKKLNADKEDQ
jgi:serine/threonine-protein kinase RsbW